MPVASRLASTVVRRMPGLKMSRKLLRWPLAASLACVSLNTCGSLMLRRM
jgi:hypothetical protein